MLSMGNVQLKLKCINIVVVDGIVGTLAGCMHMRHYKY
jgi:hypothetical protein